MRKCASSKPINNRPVQATPSQRVDRVHHRRCRHRVEIQAAPPSQTVANPARPCPVRRQKPPRHRQ